MPQRHARGGPPTTGQVGVRLSDHRVRPGAAAPRQHHHIRPQSTRIRRTETDRDRRRLTQGEHMTARVIRRRAASIPRRRHTPRIHRNNPRPDANAISAPSAPTRAHNHPPANAAPTTNNPPWRPPPWWWPRSCRSPPPTADSATTCSWRASHDCPGWCSPQRPPCQTRRCCAPTTPPHKTSEHSNSPH